MEVITIFCFLVAILHLVQSDAEFDKRKWSNEVRDFATGTRRKIQVMYGKTNRLCSGLRQHVIHRQEQEVFNSVIQCERSTNDTETCYKHYEQIFRDQAFIVAAPAACTDVQNMCSSWLSETARFSENTNAPPCLYFQNPSILIDIWSACSFWKPVHDVERALETNMGFGKNSCSELALKKKSKATNRVREEYAYCNHNLTMILNSNPERESLECNGWIRFDSASSKIERCFSLALQTFNTTVVKSGNELRGCRNEKESDKSRHKR